MTEAEQAAFARLRGTLLVIAGLHYQAKGGHDTAPKRLAVAQRLAREALGGIGGCADCGAPVLCAEGIPATELVCNDCLCGHARALAEGEAGDGGGE